jgi:hypothetical protein
VSGENADGAGGPGDDAAWRELVASFELPADPPDAAPWPDREDLVPPPRPGPPRHVLGPDRTRVIRPATQPPVPAASSLPAEPDAAGAADTAAGPAADPADEAEEHFIPPPPPPLPDLDPIAKGAWAALFGGPAYLLGATLLGWQVPGWAALLAVMAFVGGFAVLVLRLGDGPSRGAGPDNGAVL